MSEQTKLEELCADYATQFEAARRALRGSRETISLLRDLIVPLLDEKAYAIHEHLRQRAESAEAALAEAKRGWVSVNDGLPETQSHVIAFYKNKLGKGRRIRAYYVPKFSIRDDGEYDGESDYNEAEDESYWPEGWYESNENQEADWFVDDEVTHWHLMPDCQALQSAPPQSKEGK